MQNTFFRQRRIVATLVLASFFMVILGLFHSGMTMSSEGHMNCPFSPGGSACEMPLGVHLSMWQKIFTATVEEVVGIFAVLTVALGAFFFKRQFFGYFYLFWRRYVKEHPQVHLFDFKRELLSQGILHPKIYSVVTV